MDNVGGIVLSSLEELVLEKITVFDVYNEYLVDYEVKSEDGTKWSKPYAEGFHKDKKSLCPLHGDTDPSLGDMRDKKRRITLYHCFGCGRTGDAITLYQHLVNKRYIDIGKAPHEYITRREATRRLASKLGISEKDVVEKVLDTTNIFIEREIKLMESMKKYTIRDFENSLLAVRMSDYNTANKKILVNRNLIRLLEQELSEQ